MVAVFIEALLTLVAAQDLHVSPTDCSQVGADRWTERDLGGLTTGGSYLTCPPEGSGRHLYRFNGFEGERVSFSLSGYTVSGPEDLNLELTVTGPKGFRARGAVRGASILLNLPHTGEYLLQVQNLAPPGVVPYMISAVEHEARPPQRFDDCSRFSLPSSRPGIEIASHFLRPGGSAVVRPVWRMRGRDYEARNECFTDWNVSTPLARLSRNRVGNWTLILDPKIPENTSVQVTAIAGGQRAVNTIVVDTTETDP